MALVVIQNTLQVNFESILSLPNGGMLKVFKSLESYGLRGLLGFSTVIYEEDFQEFLSNAKMEQEIVSIVMVVKVVFTEEMLTGVSKLPTEGLSARIDCILEDSHSVPVFHQTAAQLRDLEHTLTLEKRQSKELLTSFKSEFDQRMKYLKISVEYIQLASTRQFLLDEVQKSSSEVNSSLAPFGSQLEEIIAQLTRACDTEKEERSGRKESSSSNKGCRWF
ncbi:hypothetical protein F511_29614 [Dorcoceras hygrometricum]|uniref:Uncharacterized protein n=1 Tax=Dorcoceras hygrometricum TaxID=472368 RepID=A0A2Z7CTT6_9LAMI|nr:hypothetical protein F511_29614 [Dorcoceras hygrometricum]